MHRITAHCLPLVVFPALACSSENDPTPDPMASGGGSGGTPAGTSTDVSGTVTLPEDASGACVMVAVDDNTTGADGTTAMLETEVSGTSVPFSLTAVQAGSYFLWAYVDTDGSSSNPASGCTIGGSPASGDFLGYYGTDSLREPASPNVVVPHAGTTFDFSIDVFP